MTHTTPVLVECLAVDRSVLPDVYYRPEVLSSCTLPKMSYEDLAQEQRACPYSKGTKKILVITGHFTKYAISLFTTDFQKGYIDQGSDFESALIKDLHSLLGTSKQGLCYIIHLAILWKDLIRLSLKCWVHLRKEIKPDGRNFYRQ